MKTILITNRKGGVGKTTTVINIAGVLSKKGFKVLLVDLDTQGNLSLFFGINDKGVHSALISENKSIPIIKTKFENIYISNADINFNLSKIDEKFFYIDEFMILKAHKKLLLKKLIQRSSIEDKFDFCIIDTSPSFDILLLNAIKVTNYIITPAQPDFFSIEGLKQFFSILFKVLKKENKNAKFLGIIPVMVNKTLKKQSEFLRKMKDILPDGEVFPYVRRDYQVLNMFDEGKIPVIENQNIRISKDYKEVVDKIIQKMDIK